MISELQREALAVLADVWTLSPDVRLGQLAAHLGFLGEVHVGKGLGDIEDDELVAVLNRHKTELVNRLHGTENSRLPPVGPFISISGSPMLPESAPGQ